MTEVLPQVPGYSGHGRGRWCEASLLPGRVPNAGMGDPIAQAEEGEGSRAVGTDCQGSPHAVPSG